MALLVWRTRNIVVFLLALAAQHWRTSTASAQCDFPAIFNFGDSNSDTGGLSAAFGQVPPPYGQTFFHSPAGRYSDGRLVIDFIAESLGLPHLSAYLDSMRSNFNHGANFATAGSTVRIPNSTITQSGISPFSLSVQLIQFSEFQARSQSLLIHTKGGITGEMLPKEEYFSRALYTLDMGQNDLTAGYKLNMSTQQVMAYVPDVLAQLCDVVKKIYGQGGRSFWIHNTGPLGCLPYTLEKFPIAAAQIDKFGCASPFNEAAQFYNKKLKEAVAQLRKELPSAAVTYVDVYSLKYALIAEAKSLGFEKPLIACCGHGGEHNFNNAMRCGSKKEIGGKQIVIAKACKNAKVRVSWDGIHYTEAANKWVFDQIVNGSFSDPPIPLNMAFIQRQMSSGEQTLSFWVLVHIPEEEEEEEEEEKKWENWVNECWPATGSPKSILLLIAHDEHDLFPGDYGDVVVRLWLHVSIELGSFEADIIKLCGCDRGGSGEEVGSSTSLSTEAKQAGNATASCIILGFDLTLCGNNEVLLIFDGGLSFSVSSS
ncbi:hypothetical protein V2J09_015470 [Rumex salicifolius]